MTLVDHHFRLEALVVIRPFLVEQDVQRRGAELLLRALLQEALEIAVGLFESTCSMRVRKLRTIRSRAASNPPSMKTAAMTASSRPAASDVGQRFVRDHALADGKELGQSSVSATRAHVPLGEEHALHLRQLALGVAAVLVEHVLTDHGRKMASPRNSKRSLLSRRLSTAKSA
jgi:hypothetical protein